MHVTNGSWASNLRPTGYSSMIRRAETKPCRIAFVTSSETTSSAWSHSPASPQRRSVIRVKLLLMPTDASPPPSAHAAVG